MKDLEKNRLLRESEIGIWIDTYDDIFSDFDPRPYSQRSLSQDFLNETKKASKDKTSEDIEIKFLVPKKLRNIKDETLIKKRLRDHFRNHTKQLKKERMKIIKEGIFFSILGVLFMIFATFILTENNPGFFIRILGVFFEPGGWFFFWQGLDLMIFQSRTETPDFGFYKKMSKADIIFNSY
ncbi:MAG TPA: hypothetical protein VMC80_02935 [Patescibacteria group bacterium]|nr:hypothetical protein [Patescibacteria group bacterium]